MSNSIDWHFTVWAKNRKLDEVTVPRHQMEAPSAELYLKHLVVCSCGYSAETTARYFVNRRKGALAHDRRFDPYWDEDPDRKVVQLFCGDWEHYGKCEFPLSDEVAAFIKHNRELNTRGNA